MGQGLVLLHAAGSLDEQSYFSPCCSQITDDDDDDPGCAADSGDPGVWLFIPLQQQQQPG